MAELGEWRKLYINAYKDHHHPEDLDSQDTALRVLSSRANWLIEELRTWTETSTSHSTVHLRNELNDVMACMQQTRDFHYERSSSLNKETSWLAYHARMRCPLPEVARYELELHRQTLALAGHLKLLAPKDEIAVTRGAD
ncbi:hypothetical protein CLAFUW4_12138 [Fulvia fulva]|uniref:Uncharacterized protein n=1 Tax=Passalora fulva TaxID=5499 RepID=A0A9Q8PER3_PASFU|nr:uncharacterized protein CLAFUR5_11177 [Fulvia fulva]KAK4617622.1 hypothetical protein CLAFUR4_12143 [Fulvia fulva]KAK4618584.1 hypothetical protein CLAFUR0_12154 [Fulvia fulva]UJO21239.1 hypothetical protein CLAFUR5_11177 [Fulvia fulva]WPV18702.1 hypothetical protein CLAFUW4_12138 [Fulvia fulva]WPV33389.1 hypothetical protein CLAFUW7_12145 [Fulvia fulva]